MKVIVNDEQYNKLIKESRGYKKSLESWNNIVVDAIMESIFDIKDHDIITLPKLSKLYGENEFFNDLPIESIIIDVSINYYSDSDVSEEEYGLAYADTGYLPQYSKLKDDFIEDVEFILEVSLPTDINKKKAYQALYDQFRKLFIHEILHVYEWYKRDLEEPAEKKGGNCLDIYTQGRFDGDIVDRIGYLLYIQSSFEMNAFIQQGGYILRQMGIKDTEDFMREYKNLFLYKYINALINFDDIDAYNKVRQLSPEKIYLLFDMKDCFYSKKDEDGTMVVKKENVSIEKFLKDIKKVFNIRGTAMKRKLQKMIVDII